MDQNDLKPLDSPLTEAEKRFIKGGQQRNAPGLFLVQHIYSCRVMGLEPDFIELDKLHEMCQKFIIDGDG